MAEIELCKGNPRAWLLNGPGKNSDTLPGWSAPVKGQPRPERRAANPLMEARMQALLATLLEALAPYPEARAALAAALAGGTTGAAERGPVVPGSPGGAAVISQGF
jgi:hypothetical protein